MDEHKQALVRGIGVGLGIVGLGGFLFGGFEPAPWLLVGLSASILSVSILYKGE